MFVDKRASIDSEIVDYVLFGDVFAKLKSSESLKNISSFINLGEQNEFLQEMPKKTLLSHGSMKELKKSVRKLNEEFKNIKSAPTFSTAKADENITKSNNFGRLVRLLLAHIIRAMIRGYVTYVCWKGRKFYKLTFRQLFFDKQAFNMGISCAILVAVHKIIQQLLREGFQKESFEFHGVAGFLAGLSICLSPMPYPMIRIFGLAFFIRGIHEFAELKVWQNDQEWGKTDIGIYSILVGVLFYAVVHQPDALSKAYRGSIMYLGAMNFKGFTAHCTSHSDNCHLTHPYELPNCASSLPFRFLYSMKRCLPVYSVVHFVPSLIFKFKTFTKSPLRFLYNCLTNTIRSSSFFASMASILQLGICLMATVHGKQHKLGSFAIGVASGSALLIEKSHRWKAFVCYVAPQTFQTLLNIKLPNVANSKKFTVLAFAIGLGLLCYCDSAQHIGSTSGFLVRLIFGSNRLAPIAPYWKQEKNLEE